MNNILIGNGFNIEFGGQEYLNSEIIKRLFHNLRVKEYAGIFGNKITSSEMFVVIQGLADEVPNILDGKYDKFCITPDEQNTLNRFKTQYSKHTLSYEIGMEDYFFILKIFHGMYNDPDEMIKGTFNGLCWLLLDAIFNNGAIQDLYKTIDDGRKTQLQNTLNGFDNVFTVNYDHNIESLIAKPVFYLHGNFTELLDQYDPNTLIGRMYSEFNLDNPPITTQNFHLYCNAIMGFTGARKERVLDIFYNGALGSQEIFRRMSAGLSAEDMEKINRLQYSDNDGERFAYRIILTQQKYPTLTFHQYPYSEFRSIAGELSIAGMSPNNDDHVWKMIDGNPQITFVTYYYKTQGDKDAVESLYKNLNIRVLPISELW